MSQNTATSDTAWHDDITSPATEADYRELQAQFDQLQTELFNCRKKSASQAVQIETLAKEVDSANDRAGAIADERDALAAQVEALLGNKISVVNECLSIVKKNKTTVGASQYWRGTDITPSKFKENVIADLNQYTDQIRREVERCY